MNFATFIYLLRRNKYNIDYRKSRFIITGKNIKGYIDNCYDDKTKFYIFVDHVDLFDKYSNCPIQYTIPDTQEDFDNLLINIEKLNTEKGKEESRYFEYDKWYIHSSLV